MRKRRNRRCQVRLTANGSRHRSRIAAMAASWYPKAAEQGDPKGEASLGYAYHRGEGVLQDLAEALRWYRKAAEQGYALAQQALGHAYYSGQGVQQDDTQAVAWYRKAAEQ